MDIVNKILGNIIECPLCYGEGADEENKTCKRCDGAGSFVK